MSDTLGPLIVQLLLYVLFFVILLVIAVSAILSITAGIGAVPAGGLRRLHPWATWIAGPAVRTSILSRLAIDAAKSGRREEATDLATRAVRASSHGGRTTRAHALTTLGLVERTAGRLEEAQERFEQAMRLAERGSRTSRRRSAINVGLIAAERGDLDRARTALEAAARLEPSDRDSALLLLASGYVEYLARDFGRARETWERGLEVARRHRGGTVPKFEVNLGYVALREGRLDEAIEWAATAARSADRDDPQSLPHAVALWGEALLGEGRIEEAREFLERALALHARYHHVDEGRYAATVLGRVEVVSGQIDDARRLLEESMAGAVSVGTKWGVAGLLRDLGDEAARRGDQAEGRRLLDRAVSLFRESRDEDAARAAEDQLRRLE